MNNNKITCGQCQFGNHDRCIGGMCQCGCPGFSMPLPPDERNPAIKIAQESIDQAYDTMADAIATGTLPSVVRRNCMPLTFPLGLVLDQSHRIIADNTTIPTDLTTGTIVAEYRLHRVYRRRQVIRTIEENLDPKKYAHLTDQDVQSSEVPTDQLHQPDPDPDPQLDADVTSILEQSRTPNNGPNF